MKKYTNAIIVLLSVIVLSFVLFSLLTALHVHNCMGEDCPVCQLIDNARRILGICAVIYLFFTAACNVYFIGKKTSLYNRKLESLVLQRVKITS